jgi:hypothetical protein
MQEIIAKLTAKDDKFACAYADKIIAKSRDADTWYEYFDAFASLLNHPKSLVRNRALHTVMNKVSGLCLFLLPLTVAFVELRYTAPVVCRCHNRGCSGRIRYCC